MNSPEVPVQYANDPTLRRIAQGSLSGTVAENGALVWRGIPFAAPPVGDLRWKAPRPPAPFSRHFEAVENGQPSVQDLTLAAPFVDSDGDGLVGSEDCLYMNVFAPADTSRKWPVMFWLHGGGNVGGHNASPTYDGSLLAQRHNVVVVSINYRLGVMGWFLHPAFLEDGDSADDRSGNWALLDAIQGLTWVRENIAAFGGDATNVTLFGESAGALNVCALLLSPRAEGLFHRAIAQSGGILSSSLASATNFSDDEEPGDSNSAREIVNDLLVQSGRARDRNEAKALQLTLPAAEIKQLLYGQTPAALIKLMNPTGLRLYPAPRVLRDGAVLPREPALELFARGRFAKVPVILGTNRDERRLYLSRDPRFQAVLRRTPGDYVRYANYGSLAWKQRAVDDVARAMYASGHRAIYTYRFDWDEQGTIGGVNLSLALGAAHAVEIPFVFGSGSGLSTFGDPNDPARVALTTTVSSYWTQFAYDGAPGSGRDGREVAWTEWDAQEGAPKLLILDTPADGGVRMSAEEITHQALKAALLNERGFSDRSLQAELYRSLFAGLDYDEQEYLRLAKGEQARPVTLGEATAE